MADIDVVKTKSRAWLWIVLAIVLVVVAWMMLSGTDSPTRTGFNMEGGQPRTAAVLALSMEAT